MGLSTHVEERRRSNGILGRAHRRVCLDLGARVPRDCTTHYASFRATESCTNVFGGAPFELTSAQATILSLFVGGAFWVVVALFDHFTQTPDT